MSKVVRSVKNVTKGYSSVQVKVRNATSNDPWGPTGTDMSEIAAMTFNNPSDFYEIMDMLDKRLNDKGKNWRHVLKSLKVLDYCLHEGSELVVTWARKNVYIIKTLREFQYIDEEGRDVGQTVRVSAKELTSLVLDEDRLRSERSDRKLWKSRVTGIEEFGPQGGIGGGPADTPRRQDRQQRRQRPSDEEDAEYRLAIEASKVEAEEEQRRRQQTAKSADDDDDLAKAIRLSKEEEELRRKELENQNAQSLFDDTPAPSTQPQITGYNQGYQQQGAVDWFGNPVDAQQPQTTGFLNNQYSQPSGFPAQPTGYQNGFPNGFGQQQPTLDQNQFQQQPNYLQSQPTIQPQQTAFNPLSNPYAQQPQQQQQQQQPSAIFAQPPQSPTFPSAGTHNPWATSQQQQAEALKPAPTGSNNPFASSFGRPQPQITQMSQPTLSTLAEQRTATQFSPGPNPIANYQTPPPISPPKEVNPQHARLNALLASGEGQDTFGNVGDLRIPAQHTAPGAFVNSAGQGIERLRAAQTGNNPFFNHQQFTGNPSLGTIPQGQQFNSQPGVTGVNGYGGGFGQGNTNPFGQRPGGQQQSGSLIDF